MLATQNRYLKPIVPLIVGLVAVLLLLVIGSLISGLQSGWRWLLASGRRLRETIRQHREEVHESLGVTAR